MIGVELRDPANGEPLPASDVAEVFEAMKERGVLIGKGGLRGNVFRLKPPMCVTKADADRAVDALAESLKEFAMRRTSK